MAKKKHPAGKAAPPAVPQLPAQPPDNPLLRHVADEVDRDTRAAGLQRLKALEQMREAERCQD